MPKQFKVSIQESVSARYSDAAYIVLPITRLDLSGGDADFYGLINQLVGKGVSPDNETQAAEQIEHWKSIYKDMGQSRSKGGSSFESLYKRARKSGQIPVINPFVDLYNSVSLNTRTCIGAYDTGKLNGNIELKVVDSDQEMVPIGENEGLIAKQGSVAYYDDEGIICCYWNCRDAHRTCIDAATRDVIVAIDVGTDLNSAWHAALLLSGAAARLGGKAGEPVIVNSKQPQHLFNLAQGV